MSESLKKLQADISVTAVIPILNETESLKNVIDYIIQNCSDNICEILIILSSKTNAITKEIIKSYDLIDSPCFQVLQQAKDGLGAALREGLERARGSHAIVIYSDGEADLVTINTLINSAIASPDSIISASRWISPGDFESQGFFKRRLNFIAQKVTSTLFRSKLTDFTFGFRIYPLKLIRQVQWEQNDHSFVYESILKPLKLNIEIKEIPTPYKLRRHGKSSWPLWRYWSYAYILLICYFQSPKLIKNKSKN